MTDVSIAETVQGKPGDGMIQLINGRTYGDSTADPFAKLRQMPVPKEMDALVTALHGASKLLALKSESHVEAICSAYGDDLNLLIRYRDAFKQTIEAAIRARANIDQTDAQAFLGTMVEKIGDIAHEPLLDLSDEAMKLDSPAMLARLQQEFRDDVDDLKACVAMWMHALVEQDIVSAIQWFGRTGVKYHFYHLTGDRAVVDRKTVDPGMSVRGRFVTTTTMTEVNVFSERRVHTVVNAKVHALGEYARRVPDRIARFIDSIPAEVKPFVTIVDGHVSKEEIHRTTADHKVTVEEHKRWVPDPTPVLFNAWALAGWGGSLREPSRATYQGHAAKRADVWLAISVVLTSAAALTVIPFAGTRGSFLVGIIGLLITIGSQVSMRVESARNPHA